MNHDFDFLMGSWAIHNRRKQVNTMVADEATSRASAWQEFPGKHLGEVYLDGRATIEHFEATFPNGQLVKGLTVRAFDPTTEQWYVQWLDNRQPPDLRPLVGGFKNGIGEFYQVIEAFDGRPLDVRFTWDNITPTSARWQQAFSLDGGQTWETNWIMEFSR